MGRLKRESVDLVCCDLPWGVTKCWGDDRIEIEPLWKHYRRVIKSSGVIVLFSRQPLTSLLVVAGFEWFRYEIIWDKKKVTGYLDARRRPLRRHENLVVFSPQAPTYNPVMSPGGRPYVGKRSGNARHYGRHVRQSASYSGVRYPTSIVEFTPVSKVRVANEKPLELMEYLVSTYSNEGDLVLDNAMGSGTTGVAALLLGRRFIGVEKDPGYFEVAKERVRRWRQERHGDDTSPSA